VRALANLVAVIVFSTGAVAQAQDRPRFYVGAAVGQSKLGQGLSTVGISENFLSLSLPTITVTQRIPPLDDAVAWKVVAGFRPRRVLGAELQYVNFGEAETGAGIGPQVDWKTVTMKTHTDATVLTALIFIPHGSSSFDVYGKVGVAKVEESFDVHTRDSITSECLVRTCTFALDVDQTETRPYVGIGGRFRIARAAAVRAEYEIIDRDVGDNTTMLSVGVAWER